jgi:hypothetical protein
MTPKETVHWPLYSRRWASERNELDEEQQQQLAEENARCEELRKWRSWKLTHEMIKSELKGLYDEVDKLVKIMPKEPITPLQLKLTNYLVGEAKALLSEDTAICQVEIFVDETDLPEYRDVIIVLRQIRQGLERFEAKNKYIFSSNFDRQLEEYNL